MLLRPLSFRHPRIVSSLVLSAACVLTAGCNAVSPDSSEGPERGSPTLDAERDLGPATDDAALPDIGAPDAGEDTSTTDATPTDTATTDTAPTDSGPTDTATTDTGTTDTAPSDTGATDTGTTDTAPSDTGTTDSGTTDTATPDTGTTDSGATDTGTTDTGAPDTGTPDTGTADTSGCDLDFDGALAESCGGLDCDDTTALIGPDVLERCDFIDNNCSGEVNEGLDCRVYVHTSTRLYLSDPFLGTLDELGTVPSLFDLDTAPDGTVYGVTSGRALQRFDGVSWSLVGSLGITANLNGFAIDGFGRAYGTGGTSLFTIDTAAGTSTEITSTSGYTSSGDCVVDKNDVLFMTAGTAGADDLVILDTTTGLGTRVGSVGFSDVYGLTATYGFMFGFTGQGDVIEIDPNTGAGTLLHSHPGIQFYGAASSANR